MSLYRELCQIMGEENVLSKEPMSRHTTFRIGGPAAFSYTHLLDATKQIPFRVSLCIRSIARGAVSYTHLDVYKRQLRLFFFQSVWYCFLMGCAGLDVYKRQL